MFSSVNKKTLTIFIFLLNLDFFYIRQLTALDGKLKYHVEPITLLRERGRQTHRQREGGRETETESGRERDK